MGRTKNYHCIFLFVTMIKAAIIICIFDVIRLKLRSLMFIMFITMFITKLMFITRL